MKSQRMWNIKKVYFLKSIKEQQKNQPTLNLYIHYKKKKIYFNFKDNSNNDFYCKDNKLSSKTYIKNKNYNSNLL